MPSSLIVGDGGACAFCRTSYEVKELLAEYLGVENSDVWEHEVPQHLDEDDCPDCEAQALVRIDNAFYTLVCMGCGSQLELGEHERCTRCDRLMRSGEIVVCDLCFDRAVDKDPWPNLGE